MSYAYAAIDRIARALAGEKLKRPPSKSDQATRIAAVLDTMTAACIQGLSDHDRWLAARDRLTRKLTGRRSTSSLPALADLVVASPIVSATMVAKELSISTRAALDLIGELDLREMTGRGRYRAWEMR